MNSCKVAPPATDSTLGPTDDARGMSVREPDPGHHCAEQLRDYSLGGLGDDDLTRVAAHLEGCETCRAAMDGFFERDEFLRRLRAASWPGSWARSGDWYFSSFSARSWARPALVRGARGIVARHFTDRAGAGENAVRGWGMVVPECVMRDA